MLRAIKRLSKSPVKCYHADRVHVQSHLAVTPSEMNQMRLMGVPISSQMEPNNFYDGDSSPSVSIDPMLMRGVDIIDAWNAEQSAKNNLRNGYLKDVKVYGK